MNIIIEKLISLLVDHNVVSSSEIDIYRYGIRIVFYGIIDVLSIVLIAIILNIVPETLFFHIGYIPLRQTAGGFHANTRLGCFAISTSLWLLSLLLARILVSYIHIPIIIASASLIVLCVFAPIDNPYNPPSTEKRKKLRCISLIIAIFYTLVLIAFMFPLPFRVDISIPITISLGMASSVCLILASKIKSWMRL